MGSEPIYLGVREGDVRLIDWKDRKALNCREGIRAHAIFFADGSVFDCYSGWRQPSKYTKPIVRMKMGRAVV